MIKPLLIFEIILAVFILFSLYVFSRLQIIRLPRDAANLMMTIYLILAAIIAGIVIAILLYVK